MRITAIPQWIFIFFIAGCNHNLSSIDRRAAADTYAIQNSWHRTSFNTTPFELVSYIPDQFSDNELLTVYIEGDGFAWLTSSQPSSDPTPRNPIGLELAFKHPQGQAAYLARPCQYHDDVNTVPQCHKRYWTTHRFSPEVIHASDQALSLLKDSFRAQKLILVGYSGGAAIAALLAARRNDVVKLITVSGNLDHLAWTNLHKLSPLKGSLNPIDYQNSLAMIPQIHFVGEKDQNIPPILIKNFTAEYPSDAPANIVIVPNQTHSCCWQDIWADITKNAF